MPKTARIDTHFKRRFAYLALKLYLNAVIYWIYGFLVTPFKIIPQDFQWILGILTPLPKMLFVKLYLKICSKAYGSITGSMKVCVVHNLALQHALFMTITMGFTATRTTAYTILGLKLFTSMYKGLKIIYKLKYTKKGYSEKEGRFLLKNILYTLHYNPGYYFFHFWVGLYSKFWSRNYAHKKERLNCHHKISTF